MWLWALIPGLVKRMAEVIAMVEEGSYWFEKWVCANPMSTALPSSAIWLLESSATRGFWQSARPTRPRLEQADESRGLGLLVRRQLCSEAQVGDDRDTIHDKYYHQLVLSMNQIYSKMSKRSILYSFRPPTQFPKQNKPIKSSLGAAGTHTRTRSMGQPLGDLGRPLGMLQFPLLGLR